MNKITANIIRYCTNSNLDVCYWELDLYPSQISIKSKRDFDTSEKALNSLKRFLKRWFPNYVVKCRIHEENMKTIELPTIDDRIKTHETKVQKYEREHPGWTLGRRGPRQLGVYDG